MYHMVAVITCDHEIEGTIPTLNQPCRSANPDSLYNHAVNNPADFDIKRIRNRIHVEIEIRTPRNLLIALVKPTDLNHGHSKSNKEDASL